MKYTTVLVTLFIICYCCTFTVSQLHDDAIATIKEAIEKEKDGDSKYDCNASLEELWSEECQMFPLPQATGMTRKCKPTESRLCGQCRIFTQQEVFCLPLGSDGTCDPDIPNYIF